MSLFCLERKVDMSNKVYDILKISALIFIPAIATLIATLGEIWGWHNADKIVATINALAVCLGAILTKLSMDYNAKKGK